MAGLDIATLAKAVQGQAAKAGQGFGLAPEVAAFAGGGLATGQQEQSVAGGLYNAEVQTENAQRAAAAARQAEMRRLQDLKDPSKYRIVRKDDGGFDFFDPEGKQVDIATFSAVSGKKPADIIADSDNPIDIQYRQDHEMLNEYIGALKAKDTKTLNEMRIADPRLQQFDDEGGIYRLTQLFKSRYRRYYEPRTTDPTSWGANPGSAVFRHATEAEQEYGNYGGGGGTTTS